tara:strand:- start:6930 stop:7217 length:288 start_codon:yes stop_codon:yes gene_type:complete
MVGSRRILNNRDMAQVIINEINRDPDFAVHDDYREGNARELLVYNTSGNSMSDDDLDELYTIASSYGEVLYVERKPRDSNYALVGLGEMGFVPIY